MKNRYRRLIPAVMLLTWSAAFPTSAIGARGGLVVLVGCDDPAPLVTLRASDSCLAHGLDTDAKNVANARKHIQSKRLYGKVSVDMFDGKNLPYADNLVNLLVAEKLGGVTRAEVLRVLAPLGVANVGGKKFVIPRPKNIDDWTHYLHSASGNPVAQDDAVRPPRQLQWVASPKWGRHHEHMASMNAMVSSDGKVFSICDQGPRVSMMHPPQWKLSAHDAVDPSRQPRQGWPVFRHDSARSGHTAAMVPANLTQQWSADIGGKLTQPVTADGKVYVASIDRHALHALSAKTGKPIWRYTAGGRIDSPPSIYRGMAIFGSRNGWITCLRCGDGELAWRFRAVPKELLVMSYGQLESAWPVHGSVLIENNEIHCLAGRNMFLDGGLCYPRLEPATGRKISETIMDGNTSLTCNK